MTFKKKIVTCMASAMAMAVLLAGCGNSNNEQTATGEPQVTEAAEDKAEETAAPTTETAAEDEIQNKDASTMSLKEAYKDLFDIGVAVNSWQLADKKVLARITKDYSTFTCENEMKPDYLLDHNASMEAKDGMPVLTTEKLDEILTMAEDAGLKMRGHTLVWHSQTPEWLFREGYDDGKDYVDKDTMLKRMESYIKKVITYCQEKHPGVVYAWDVVNECASDNKGLRTDSLWYKVIGEEYIEKAFEYARKYADKDVKLFINDYGMTSPERRKTYTALVKKIWDQGNIDGIGMQSHHDRENFDVAHIETSIYAFSAIADGIEIQLTELDMHYNDNSEAAMKEQAENYKKLFDLLVNVDTKGHANITNVTFWGLDDEHTWLTGFKKETSYPLLYDKDGNAKPSYFAIIEAAEAAKAAQ